MQPCLGVQPLLDRLEGAGVGLLAGNGLLGAVEDGVQLGIGVIVAVDVVKFGVLARNQAA